MVAQARMEVPMVSTAIIRQTVAITSHPEELVVLPVAEYPALITLLQVHMKVISLMMLATMQYMKMLIYN